MLNDAVGFKKIYLACGYTDLRRGIDGLAAFIQFQFNLDPYDKGTAFLFCGKRTDRIKLLVWEGDHSQSVSHADAGIGDHSSKHGQPDDTLGRGISGCHV